jgi:PTS system nitrogen regulatory IIA component
LQLTVRDVSKFLNVAESTVTRWIKQRGLPAQYVGGRYRFNRVEVFDWAIAHQIKVEQSLGEPPGDSPSGVSLAEALEAGGIHYKVPGDEP